MAETDISSFSAEQYINDILATIERERERDIVTRRFWFF
jgi:hypothetical protein